MKFNSFRQLGAPEARELTNSIMGAFYARYPEVLQAVNYDAASFGELTEKTKTMVREALDRDSVHASKREPWQNLDSILDVLDRAGCCTGTGYIHAAEDVVANALRNWLRTSSVPPANSRTIIDPIDSVGARGAMKQAVAEHATMIGGTNFCGHGVMASICPICSIPPAHRGDA
jgi:hypothetical protein